MAEPKVVQTLETRFKASEQFIDKGKTAEASDLNQLTITQTLIEILATLDRIADVLEGSGKAPASSSKPVPAQPGPVQLAAAKGK